MGAASTIGGTYQGRDRVGGPACDVSQKPNRGNPRSVSKSLFFSGGLEQQPDIGTERWVVVIENHPRLRRWRHRIRIGQT